MTADVLLADVVQQRDLNEAEARGLVDGMRADVADLGDRIATAYIGKDSGNGREMARQEPRKPAIQGREDRRVRPDGTLPRTTETGATGAPPPYRQEHRMNSSTDLRTTTEAEADWQAQRSRSPGYIYVASSWRNAMQPAVIEVLKVAGLDAYDFRNPPGNAGFGWEEVMPGYVAGSESVLPADYLPALDHPRAQEGFASDFAAMEKADTFVLVLPCGRSAHLELGWAVGAGKRTAILLEGRSKPMVPELMYLMVDHIAPSVFDLLGWLRVSDGDDS